MYIVLLGPPGSGKSTYSRKLVKEFGFHHLPVGNVLRSKKDHIIIREYIDRGELVPISVILEILKESSEILNHQNLILDGIPRSIEQIEILDSFLKVSDKKVDIVIGFNIDESLAMDRILSRIICINCEEVYNLKFVPPAKQNICNVCNNALTKREDDIHEIIIKRYKSYKKNTEPLISLYKSKNLYKEFNVSKNVENVWTDISTFIKERL